jgi:uncharacterized protein with GYD domain
MSQFLFEVAYTSNSWATQVRKQGNVLERIEPLITGFGGSITSCYYAFGDYDLVLIADFASNEDAAAFSLAVTAGGSLKSIKSTALLTVGEGITAMKRAAELGQLYQAPVATVPAQG